MGKDRRFHAMCAGTIFYLLGGVYLVDATVHVALGEVFISIGFVFLVLAMREALKPRGR
jgi:hypothetical protein